MLASKSRSPLGISNINIYLPALLLWLSRSLFKFIIIKSLLFSHPNVTPSCIFIWDMISIYPVDQTLHQTLFFRINCIQFGVKSFPRLYLINISWIYNPSIIPCWYWLGPGLSDLLPWFLRSFTCFPASTFFLCPKWPRELHFWNFSVCHLFV